MSLLFSAVSTQILVISMYFIVYNVTVFVHCLIFYRDFMKFLMKVLLKISMKFSCKQNFMKFYIITSRQGARFSK